jgi:uncharacterized protein
MTTGGSLLRRYPLLSYVLLAYGLTWTVMLPLLLARRGLIEPVLPNEFEAVAAFGPFLAAWWVSRAAGARGMASEDHLAWRDRLRRWRLAPRGLAIAFGSPLLFMVCALAAVAFVPEVPARLAAPGNETLSATHALVELILIGAIAQAAGEEPGWRGYLQPKLRERFTPLKATLVLYPFWLFWHLPMVLSRPEIGLGAFAGFALGILSAAVWLAWLELETRSVPAAIAWHAGVNVLRGLALGISTLAFLAFGVAVTLSALAVAVVLWRAGRRPATEANARGI